MYCNYLVLFFKNSSNFIFILIYIYIYLKFIFSFNFDYLNYYFILFFNFTNLLMAFYSQNDKLLNYSLLNYYYQMKN